MKGKLSLGLFSVVSSILLLAILIIANLAVGKLPSEYTELDISGTGLYSLSDQTRETADRITEDVYLYWITPTGSENSEIEVLLDRYRDLSDYIHVEKVDPIVNPDFTDEYTLDTVPDNSVIVVCGDHSRFISYDDIFTYNYNYFSDEDTTTDFNAESKITSAIDYVTNGREPKLYRLTGHGESVLSTALETAVGAENYIIESVSLVGMESVPEDAECIMMVSPESDITADEADVLSEYLDNGGRLLLYTDYGHTDLPNLMGILADYGLTAEEGLIFEGDQYRCYGNYPMQLVPIVGYHDITSPLTKGGYSVIAPMAHGIVVGETPSNITVTELLKTSDSAFAKKGDSIESLSKEAGDADGPFAVGVAAEKGSSGDGARIVWYSTSELIDKNYDELVNGTNTDLALNSIGWLTDKTGSITIHAKQISSTKLTVPSGASTRTGILLIGVVPLLYFAVGAVVTFIRRKK